MSWVTNDAGAHDSEFYRMRAAAGADEAVSRYWQWTDSLDGLNGDYLLHPYHWTCVDRWFDPEMPGAIVDPAIAHLYRWADGPLLS
ncbi:hypothetical protein [Nocardia nova]|uniref:hypothetical protein n=1 Tax=Nocardia nova TaxID=37330 RepID=UPI003F6C8915